ncbi:MAG: PA2169 family four-helix-bundle protein [Chthoniobacterales bacterium]
MAQTTEMVSTLNSLIETLKDGQEGFRQAAEAVKDGTLKSLFSEYSLQRAKFAGELQNEVIRSLGDSKPEETSSVSGALHRAWINLKSALTSGDDHAILAECERGEDSAISEYRKAIEDENLSSPLRDIVSRQYTEVKAAHDRVKALRDQTKGS